MAPPNPRRPGASPGTGERGRGAGPGLRRSEAGRVVWSPPGLATEDTGKGRAGGPRGSRQPGDPPGPRPSPFTPKPVALPGRARRVHTHLPLRGPRFARRAGGHRRALCGAERNPIPDRRPARAVQTGRAPAGHQAAPPPPPRCVLPLRGGVGRGGEQPPPAPQAGARAGQILSKQALGSRLGARRALRPALGSLRVSPQAQGRLRLQTSPPPCTALHKLFLAPLFLGVCFMGSTLVMGVPDGKGVEATKPLVHAPLPAHPQTGRVGRLRCKPGFSTTFKSAGISVPMWFRIAPLPPPPLGLLSSPT